MSVEQPLKLAAHDTDDLTVLSSILQDATVLIGDMGYDDAQFMMVAARFIADNNAKQRRLMGVNFSSVKSIKRQGFSLADKDNVLNLLAIRTNDANIDPVNIDIIFSGAAMVRLECQAIKVYAADLGEGWLTSFTPKH